jgi:hypothetical protein
MKTKKIRLDTLPPVHHPERKLLIEYMKSESAQKKITEDKLPFFTEDELKKIEDKYSDGLKKDTIMALIYEKGWTIKESTIKHYIQKELIPPALKRIKTTEGMVSIYPPDTIRHINFVRYSLFQKDYILELLSESIKKNDKMVLEEISWEIADEGEIASNRGNDCIHSLYVGIDGYGSLPDEGIPWTEISINRAFENDRTKREKYLKLLDNIKKQHKKLEETINQFVEELEKTKLIDFEKTKLL